jgi:ElaB/YqjD/DUF883 family membrane-anchored ribosome-binding protein
VAARIGKNGTKNMDARLGALRSELETLEADVKRVTGDVEGIADNRIHLAIHKAEDIAHRAYHLAEETTAQAVDDVEAWASGNLDSARKSIRAQPFSALALSVGVGALVGAILGVAGRRPAG